MCSNRGASTIVVKSFAAIVNFLVEVAGSNLGNSISASRDLRASLTMPAIATARAVGCIPVVVRMNNSSSNGPSGASKAAMEVFATVYRAELKRFGIDEPPGRSLRHQVLRCCIGRADGSHLN
jgi:hypothetical protein